MATAFFRTVILYLLLIAGLRLSGKRQIGELEPIELVLTLLISDLASVPMQDFALPLFNGVIPIITLIALSTLFSAISLRNVRFRDLVCGQPALVIVDGKLRQETMRRNRLTLDELFQTAYSEQAQRPELAFLPRWQTCELDLAAAYAQRMSEVGKKGYGMFAKHHVFTVENGR